MKRNSLLDSIPDKIMDEDAASLIDIIKMKGIQRGAAAELRDMNLASGAWEEVYKHQSGKLVHAYRLKKKPK